jgi:hypothetical protein
MKENIKVAIRIKPLSNEEKKESDPKIKYSNKNELM